MKFGEWVEKNRGELSRTKFLTNFAKKCGVSIQTLQFTVKGGRVSLYPKAQAISKETGGEVSVPELCE